MGGLKLEKDKSLKSLNTFGVDVNAKLFVEVKNKEEATQLMASDEFKKEKVFILGGGSNTLFTKDVGGLVVKVKILGKNIAKENNKHIWIEIGAGEDWHKFVTWAVENNYGGVENLALIPGTVGGAATQNIAAYGQNLSEVFDILEAVEMKTSKIQKFDKKECKLAYRTSFFKKEGKNKFIITSVTLKLNKKPKDLETHYHEREGRYGSLEEELQSFAQKPYSITDVYKAVIRQRTKRLPNIDELGCAGCFFVNPVVTVEKFKELSKKISELQHYPVENLSYFKKDWKAVEDEEYVKIPAGRIIDEKGWRGKWTGNTGVSEKHALCIVTNKKASGKEIVNLARKIQEDIKKAYGVKLKSEVNIV